jgi:corrinoid protein of di/trimethylamine methyltransferase
MFEKEEILKELYEAVLQGDIQRASNAAELSLKASISPLVSIEEGLSIGIREVGNRFNRMEMFLPEMVLSSKAMEAALKVLEPHLVGQKAKRKGRVLIGTVKGDIHDIGRKIVVSLLKANRYEVVDLGRDIPPYDFLDKAKELQPQVIGMSGLLTTSMPEMQEVIQLMVDEGVRNNYIVIIGGGPTSQDFADQIGADGYGRTAYDAVLLCDNLLGSDNPNKVLQQVEPS